MAGLYIHIPFCESRCIYCGFYSTTSLKLRDAYVDALIKEMSLRPIHQELEEGEKIETVYLGGGTPSQLTGEQLIKLFDGINKYLGHFTRDMEITIECNPDDITEDIFSQELYTSNMPDPDLLIRTGGEMRVSNYLLWQIAYSEFLVMSEFWPEFDKNTLAKAVFEFHNRHRRYGK